MLDFISHGLLERGDTAIDLGDGQPGLEAQHDLDKDDAAGAPRPDAVEPLKIAGASRKHAIDRVANRLAR